jgi:hypothetical protein
MSQSQSLRINRTSTFAQQRGSTAGLIGAVIIHVGIIAATLFTFAHKLDIVDQSSPIVPVDLITIGDKTNIRPTVTKEQKVQADQESQVPKPDITPPAAALPVPEKAEVAPSDVPKKSEPITQPQPKPVPPGEKKQQKFDVNNILALLNQSQSKAAAPNAKVANRSVKGIGAQDAMTADLQSALSSQIMQCWSPPVGAPNANDLVVDFDLFLNPDGSVARTPQLVGNSASEYGRNPYTRAAADAAKRAIYTCAPYKLPASRYSLWQEINPFHFDPRQMMGQ